MKIIFAGTPQFAASALAALLKEHEVVAVLTQPDRPSGRGMQLSQSPVKLLARKHNLQVLQPETLRSGDTQQLLSKLDADVMVVAAYGLILPKVVLQIPRYGCLNIHASLLPRWRGAAPVQRALLAGDQQTGITIMQMDEGLDTGDILLYQPCPIDKGDTAQTLQDKLAKIGSDCIIEAIHLLREGRLVQLKQDNTQACYAAKLVKKEAIIDWNKDAGQIEREVRAYNPFPVSQARFKGVPIKVWQAELCTEKQGIPGQVLEVDKHGVIVACRKGALRLKILQRPGGKIQPADQFLQAVPIRAGDRFDEG